jgi:uncharacterized lipoprotein
MHRMHYRILSVLVAALLFSGCAMSPQVISVQPVLDTAALPQDGASTTLALAVTDARANAVVGYRGGVYDTATITMAEDMTARVQTELAKALAARGFSVAPAGTPFTVNLLVELAELGYSVTQGQVTRTVEVTSLLRARSQAGEVTRTGEYRDTRTQEFVKPPSDAENSALINEVLSAALQRLAADADLLRY